MTVSRVLAGRTTVDVEMRRRVLAAARRLDYVPNALASSFASNRAGFIGVATSYHELLGTAFFRDMMVGFQKAVRDPTLDFALFDCTSAAFRNPKGLARIYRQKKAGGLLIVAPRMEDRYLKTLAGMGVAFIVVGEHVTDANVASVCCNDAQGIDIMVRHLLELGHRDIGFIGGPKPLGSARRRETAFLECMARAGIHPPRHFLQPGDYTVPWAKKSALAMLRHKHRPTAILGANDLSAKGAILAAHELGLDVPRDLSVAGFDDLLPPAENEVGLTTIRQPIADIAATAVERLLAAMLSGQPASGHADVDVALIVRDSTAQSPIPRPA